MLLGHQPSGRSVPSAGGNGSLTLELSSFTGIFSLKLDILQSPIHPPGQGRLDSELAAVNGQVLQVAKPL